MFENSLPVKIELNTSQQKLVNTKRFYSIQFLTWGINLFKEIEEPMESSSENIIGSDDESWTLLWMHLPKMKWCKR